MAGSDNGRRHTFEALAVGGCKPVGDRGDDGQEERPEGQAAAISDARANEDDCAKKASEAADDFRRGDLLIRGQIIGDEYRPDRRRGIED